VSNDQKLSLIKYRLEQANESLEDARFLLQNNRSSVSVVNRAYYAAFYAVLSLLQLIGKAPTKHTGVISLFDKEFVKKGIFTREYSKDLHKLFELRQLSDYKVIEPVSHDKAEQACNKTANLIAEIAAYIDSEMKKS